MRSRGFTLIELLVVIAIIGMLSSVVLASLSSARMKARDARRLQDAKQVQTALELYYNDNNTYPTPGGSYFYRLTMLTPTYISTLPEDPITAGSSRYRYWYSNARYGYTMLIWNEKNNAWCKLEQGDGYSGWDSYQYSNCL